MNDQRKKGTSISTSSNTTALASLITMENSQVEEKVEEAVDGTTSTSTTIMENRQTNEKVEDVDEDDVFKGMTMASLKEQELDVGMRFATMDGVKRYVDKFSKNNGFKIHFLRHRKQGEVDPEKYYRGRVMCAYKDKKSCLDKKTTCTFFVTFYEDGDKMFKFSKWNLHHNHPIVRKPQSILNDRARKTAALELEQKLQTDKERNMKKGNQLQDLLHYGEKIRQKGGLFQFCVDCDGRIDRVVIQTELQKKFTNVYNDFVIVDATHGRSINGMTLLFPVVVDGLGKTKVAGVFLCHTDNVDHIVFGLQTLNLAKNKSVLMTSVGQAFVAAADVLELQHILCPYLFSQEFFVTTAQMSSDIRTMYAESYNTLLYGAIHKDYFESEYQRLSTTLSEKYPLAHKFVEILYENRQKVAYTFIQEYFTAGYRSSQGSSEPMNLVLNNNGSSNWRDYQKTNSSSNLILQFDTIFHNHYPEDIEQIKLYISNGTEYSSFVQKHLNDENALMENYKSEHRGDNVFFIEPHSGIECSRLITIPDNETDAPTCDCLHYKNIKLACRHIAAALYCHNCSTTNSKRMFLNSNNVDSRWLLTSHPLYDTLAGVVVPTIPTQATSISQVVMPLNELKCINYPTKTPSRHAKLNEVCFPLIEEGKKSEFAYRIAMGVLTKCVYGTIEYLSKPDGNRNVFDYIHETPVAQHETPKNNTRNNNNSNKTMINYTDNTLLPSINLSSNKKRKVECDESQFV